MATFLIRDRQGRFIRKKIKTDKQVRSRSAVVNDVIIDHNYVTDGERSDVCRIPSVKPHVNKESWRVGRRIVEWDVLLSNLKFCKECLLGPVPLTFDSVIGEMKKGLSGFLYVRCQNGECGHVNCVPYGKTHRMSQGKGMPCFAINTKLGTAMIDSLGGPVKVNNFLSTLNLPTVSNVSLKKMERRAGNVIEKVSLESCASAAKQAFNDEMQDIAKLESEEAEKVLEDVIPDLGVAALPDSSPHLKQLLHEYVDNNDNQWIDIEDENTSLSDNLKSRERKPHRKQQLKHMECTKSKKKLVYPCKTRTGMTCAIDTAWQKKGFDSLTSHTFFMSKSKYGKKVVKSIVSHRTCGTCKWWQRNRKGQPVRKHKCVHTHSGNAKLMERVSGEKGVKELIEEGTPLEVIEGDGDNTLISRLRNNLKINMKKKFDKNHVVKNIGSSLYSLHSKKGIKLSKSVIMHIQKCLKYAFAKNVGDRVGMKQNLSALIPHQFGEHSNCQARFCGFVRNPKEKYSHSSLPYKAALKDNELRSELDKLFLPVINNSDQYCDLGSSQQCEHANREVSLRAPKMLHYGNSESLDHRVHATAAFINEGRDYIPKVHSAAGLSPGAFTENYAKKCAEHRKRIQERIQLPSTKRRRLILKQERAINQAAKEALEGVSYQSGIGHDDHVDITKLPDPVPRGVFKPVHLPNGNSTLITFDLETTDLIRDGNYPHITQIAAMELNTGHSFNEYVFPKQPIAVTAQQVTGISISSSNEMTVNGCLVEPLPIKTALNDFCTWLEKISNVILVAHNGRRFDFPVIISAINNVKLQERFFKSVSGCTDSLSVFRKQYPGRSSYKQTDLVHDILGTTYGAHDATEDVRALGHLLKHSTSQETVLSFSFPPKSVFNNQIFNREKSKNFPSLSVLVSSGICKHNIAENIAGSGLGLNHLRTIFNREGEDGLTNVFISKNSDGQPRVTSTKRVLESVIPKLVQYFSKNS